MSFSSDVNKYVDQYKRRMGAVYRQSVEDLGNRANRATDEGGQMRVDTGFLRNSQAYGLNQMPSGPTEGQDRQYTSRIGAGPTEILSRWQPGDTTFIGWTAGYARFREAKDGFMRLAAQKWSAIVGKNAKKAKAAGL